ncbi:sugar phosphate nucleotidyltransferase [Marinoscillum furvescens]|uniref:Glucose-1-phosphate thymidylyltransferase n=1 Tax=Marinoscillum furvescens DSM 4134 TaxID=1122208 RepID=A0A3D9LH14_MARFU|nr:sugar phosphate nucleotidyltransferase [Marinoscillum furvescens]REE05990.1 glucose-1-phosphate thymidylyltransferase [Marinoscillum furvescens DSM 4134]
MNLIVPMAGKGKRLRPHTLTVPKPLIPIAGKPIVQRLVEDIAAVTPEPIEKIGFVVGDFGEETEKELLQIAEAVGARGYIFYQEEALGTAHAVHCAREIMQGKVTVAFSDTLFKANFKLNTEDGGIIWVKQVDDPSAYGVVNLDQDGVITEFVEKPKEPVSALAIIGIYYFKEGEKLREQLDYIIDNDVRAGGEYQLTTALENLKQDGVKFTTGAVDAWLDCGNKRVTVESNSRYLGFLGKNIISESAIVKDSVVIPPVFIGDGVEVTNSVIGPGVSLGAGSKVSDSRIQDALIQSDSTLKGVNLQNSMIGNHVNMESAPEDVSLGDFSEWKK